MAVSGLDMALCGTRSARSSRPAGGRIAGRIAARRSRLMTVMAWSIPSADEKDLRRSLDQGFRGIKIKGGDGDAANDERVVKGGARPARPRHRADARLQPVARSGRSQRAASNGSRPTICTGSRSRWRRKPAQGHAKVRGDVADADPGRRELVVSARLCRSDRRRRERLHHARSDEVSAASPAGSASQARPKPPRSRCPATCSPRPAPTCWR